MDESLEDGGSKGDDPMVSGVVVDANGGQLAYDGELIGVPLATPSTSSEPKSVKRKQTESTNPPAKRATKDFGGLKSEDKALIDYFNKTSSSASAVPSDKVLDEVSLVVKSICSKLDELLKHASSPNYNFVISLLTHLDTIKNPIDLTMAQAEVLLAITKRMPKGEEATS